MGNVDIWNCHRAVLDLVALYHPPVVTYGWIVEQGVQFPCRLCSFDLSLREALDVVSNRVDKHKVLRTWSVIMEAAFVHTKFQIGLAKFFAVHDEPLFATVVRHEVLLNEILERYDVGNGLFVVPNIFVVAHHLCLVMDHHCSTVTLQPHGVL